MSYPILDKRTKNTYMTIKKIVLEVPISTDIEKAKKYALEKCETWKCEVEFTFNGKKHTVKYSDLMNVFHVK